MTCRSPSGATLEQVARIPDVHSPEQQGDRIRLAVDSDRTATVLPALAALGISDLRVAPPSLEELFLRHYGDDLATLEAAEDGRTDDASPSTRRERRAQKERA